MPAQQKLLENAFYSPGPIFDVKKNLAQCIPYQKLMHNLKGRKRTHNLENYPTPTSRSPRKITFVVFSLSAPRCGIWGACDSNWSVANWRGRRFPSTSSWYLRTTYRWENTSITFNDWPQGKQWVLFHRDPQCSLRQSHSQGETKLNVSWVASD